MMSLPVVSLVAPVLGSSIVVPLVTVTAVWVKSVPPPMVTHFGLLVGCWKKEFTYLAEGFAELGQSDETSPSWVCAPLVLPFVLSYLPLLLSLSVVNHLGSVGVAVGVVKSWQVAALRCLGCT